MPSFKKEVRNISDEVKNSEKNICVYCGDNAGTKDHVLPLTYFHENRKIANTLYISEGWKTLPSCMSCNSLASVSFNECFAERKDIIKNRFYKKYKKRLESRIWTNEELRSLGYVLRSHIKESMERDRILRYRYENLTNPLPILK